MLRNAAGVIGWVLIAASVGASVAATPGRAAEPPGPPPLTRLKPLFLETAVVTDGQAQASVVAPASGCYDAAARRIVQAVQSLTEVTLPVVDDKSPEAAIPLRGNVIVLGNRSTNRMIAELYDRYYTLLDLRHPGEDGYEVRSLHNPFGNGRNVIFVGGSSQAGVEEAAHHLLTRMSGCMHMTAFCLLTITVLQTDVDGTVSSGRASRDTPIESALVRSAERDGHNTGSSGGSVG